MTNHWNDIKNSDAILIMGSNAAENHPIGFKYVTEAMEKGATLISVDPRFTRTSSKADIYAQVRPGSDIAFLGGMVKYVLDNELWHDDYVKSHTNATFLIHPDFEGPADLDGVYSGLNAEARVYDKTTWAYQTDADGIPLKDETMQDPDCVLQLLKRQYERYTPELASETTGTDVETLKEVYKVYASTGAPDRVGTMMYAMGWTQHTYGTQVIRTGALLQLLLGNIGRAGGGVNALRGESNVQGSTDHCILFHILPGYLKPPIASDITLEDHLARATPTTTDPKSANWWQNYPKYFVSLLKAWYMDNATPENEFGYQWLPKLDGNYSWLALFEAMSRGDIKGFLAWGQNPVVGGANANLIRDALAKLDWLVAVNLWDLETPNFWNRPGVNPADISTEVFLLPCAASFEKEGSITNSGRWAQWRWKAVDPLGDSMTDSWITNQLMRRVRALYEAEGGPNADAITKLYWDYGDGDDVDTHFIAKEINGWFTDDVYAEDGTLVGRKGDLVPSFGVLRADGTTCSANWLYSGSYTEAGNQMARRDNKDYHPAGIGLYSKWSWCWPVNRRIIYNRASCDSSGQPYDPDRYVVWWKGGDAKWDTANGADVPDGGWAPEDKYAFIMKSDGHGHVFGPGLRDGPFPEHYEPWESVVDNPFSSQQHNPVFYMPVGDVQVFSAGERAEFPIIGTTYRVSEHWQSGAMTRNLPWLGELQPEMFVELSEELATELGLENGEDVFVRSQRGEVAAVAMVTKRFKPYTVRGQTVHVVGLPWHWGYKGLKTGSSANLLTPYVGDANTAIPETKAFLCRIDKV